MLQQIQSWHQTDSKVVYDHTTELLSEEHQLTLRLLNCLLYHWTEAGHDATCESIISKLKLGHGLRGGGQLGGNPLFDLIFAAAMLEKQNNAAIYFEQQYQTDLTKTAAGIDQKSQRYEADVPPEWWNDFYLYIVKPNNGSEPLLQKYLGLAGIKQWFRKTLTFFLRDQNKMARRREKRVQTLTDMGSPAESDDGTLLDTTPDHRPVHVTAEKLQELESSLFNAMKRAKSSLQSEEWLRITLHLVKKEQNQKIAAIFGENGATASRKRTAAMNKFQTIFVAELERDKNFEEDFPFLLHEKRHEMASLFELALTACDEEKLHV